MANNVKLLDKFFEAENKRDWPAFEGFLHPDVMWFIHAEDSHLPVVGRAEYMERIYDGHKVNEEIATFVCQGIDVSASGDRIVANLQYSDGTRSVCIFDYEDGLIRWKHEFLVK